MPRSFKKKEKRGFSSPGPRVAPRSGGSGGKQTLAAATPSLLLPPSPSPEGLAGSRSGPWDGGGGSFFCLGPAVCSGSGRVRGTAAASATLRGTGLRLRLWLHAEMASRWALGGRGGSRARAHSWCGGLGGAASWISRGGVRRPRSGLGGRQWRTVPAGCSPLSCQVCVARIWCHAVQSFVRRALRRPYPGSGGVGVPAAGSAWATTSWRPGWHRGGASRFFRRPAHRAWTCRGRVWRCLWLRRSGGAPS